MDLSFSPAEETFRGEVKKFIEKQFTEDMRDALKKSPTNYLDPQRQRIWQKRFMIKAGQHPNGQWNTVVRVGQQPNTTFTKLRSLKLVRLARSGLGPEW